MRPQADLSVYLVTDQPLCQGRDLLQVIAEAVAGGVGLVQLREKHCDTRAFVELARQVKKLLDGLHVPLLINDRVDVALAVNAAGVHLGQTDMHYTDARALLGPDAIIGLSLDTRDQGIAAQDWDLDYLGIGPVFGTRTKADAGPAWGLAVLPELARISRHPIVAIGGITPENAAIPVQAGASGVAVVSAICSAPAPKTAAQALVRAVKGATAKSPKPQSMG